MQDLVFVAALVVFAALAAVFAMGCDRLNGPRRSCVIRGWPKYCVED